MILAHKAQNNYWANESINHKGNIVRLVLPF